MEQKEKQRFPRPPYISITLAKDEEAQNQINRAISEYEEKVLKYLEQKEKRFNPSEREIDG